MLQSDLKEVVPLTSTNTYEANQRELYLEFPVQQNVSLYYLFWQRARDILFGVIGMVLLLLILPTLALLIWLDSPGPIFYNQERMGYQGRKFVVYKIRSMCVDAEKAQGTVWATKHDPRVTRVGRFMRATHLDELPQAYNILRGQMSLIGPRPQREEYASELEKVNPLYRYRLTVKPGLTGWAQVKYGYGSTSQDELIKLHYDLFYIEHRSMMFDIRILLKTVIEVVYRRGI